MLIPDNIHPEQTVYFNGAIVLNEILKNRAMDMLDLYIQTNSQHKMSMPVFVLCLDWLYLLNLIEIDDRGWVMLCT
jgi:hypothetical protein